MIHRPIFSQLTSQLLDNHEWWTGKKFQDFDIFQDECVCGCDGKVFVATFGNEDTGIYGDTYDQASARLKNQLNTSEYSVNKALNIGLRLDRTICQNGLERERETHDGATNVEALGNILSKVEMRTELVGRTKHYIYTWTACPEKIKAQTSSKLRSKKELHATEILQWLTFLEVTFGKKI